ncbi:hypothetical protein P175DRAFT_0248103 [Aspergillus ochraceoroseus IBT 24754]|uniref:Uncharacterized protein n=1 Tax=Aspergillus ochraceoroseus IBT 24754 TaxID=1392256 RepID=A0A2T5LY21_9EURO|nr:uncharacterized protein P175DRAFT_0248103 [Aspergillus ochraceoroseus IBT 24754]PTU21159.1 hypothetical protein P175DRAFT_0248103 [Aspergillus ochraceoroseus IBT 24754]
MFLCEEEMWCCGDDDWIYSGSIPKLRSVTISFALTEQDWILYITKKLFFILLLLINGALIRNYGYLSASLFSGTALIIGALCQIAARLFCLRNSC